MSTDLGKAPLCTSQNDPTESLSPPFTIKPTRKLQSNTSFAQQRICFHEKLHDDSSIPTAINNFVLPLVINSDTIPIALIHSAIVTILEQHTILRTAIHYDKKCRAFTQEVQSPVERNSYFFEITRKNVLSADEIDKLIKNEFTNHFSKVDQGLVVRCHLIKMGFDKDDEYLKRNDIIVFVFHPIAFDYNSVGPFITAFTQAYEQLDPINVTGLQYIDFAVHENSQLADVDHGSMMDEAKEFWLQQMKGYNQNENHSMSIAPITENKNNSESYCRITFDLDPALVQAQNAFADSEGISMFHVELACYFIFLYSLNNGTIKDLCVTSPTDNRTSVEMKSMIGTFINILPYRIKIEPNQSFTDFFERVCQLCKDVQKHAQLPYELIMGSTNNLDLPKIPFHFRYHSYDVSSAKDKTLSLYTDPIWLHGNDAISNDLTLIMIYNKHQSKINCIFEYSADWYNATPVSDLTQCFQSILDHLFVKNTLFNDRFDPTVPSIGDLPLQNILDIEQRSKDGTQNHLNSLHNGKTGSKLKYFTTSVHKILVFILKLI